MPHFVAICRDRAEAPDIRRETRPHHLSYMKSLDTALRLAGPITASDVPIGSMIIVEASDRKAAEAIFAEDPYVKAGLFRSVEILEWSPVIVAF
jgi:uncharacterized protein